LSHHSRSVGLSHCPGTRPFVQMVVVLPLVTLLPPVRLRLSFMKALGVVCRRSRRLIRPVHHLLPQSGSGRREQGLPEHRCFCCCCGAHPLPERCLPRRCRCRHRGRPRSCPSPAPPPPPLPSPHAPVARAWPQGGSESKWMMSSVPGKPLKSGQRASCVSRL
jgi:hypothetical protein